MAERATCPNEGCFRTPRPTTSPDYMECPDCGFVRVQKVALPSPLPDHDGDTYEPGRDKVRLNAQQQRVFDEVCDEQWHTLRDLSESLGDPEASISARLRDFRKPKFGGHEVEREYVQDGIWRYRLLLQ